MFIRCDSCGKLFNYEKNDGICPHCSAFNSPPDTNGGEAARTYTSPADREPEPQFFESTEEDIFSEESDPVPSFSPSPASVSPSPAASSGRGQRRGCRCGCFLILVPVLLIVVLLGVEILQQMQRDEKWLEWIRQPEAPQVVSCSPDEPVQTSLYTVSVSGDAVVAMEAGNEALPEGEKLIGIEIQVSVTDEYPDFTDWYGPIVPTPYLLLEDGRCRAAVDSWTLSSELPDLYAGCIDVRDLYYGDEAGGIVYFVVPADTQTITLCLEQRSQTEPWLEMIYELPLSVTEVSA